MPYRHGHTADTARMPDWMRRQPAVPGRTARVEQLLGSLELNTVCRSARCPNRGECFSAGTATFLVLGDRCTRACRFCAVEGGAPASPDHGEPGRVAEAAAGMRLGHVVVTMVTRDDLEDGGADHIVSVISAVRAALPDATVEVLVSDMGGDEGSVRTIVSAGPDVFNHNVETVPRLYGEVRPGADYERSLRVLSVAKLASSDLPTKSGLMVGLGEEPDEVVEVLRDLRRAGVEMVTIGQYLRPSARHLPVARFVRPEEFEGYAEVARDLGFTSVAAAPFVRSSYRASEAAGQARATRESRAG